MVFKCSPFPWGVLAAKLTDVAGNLCCSEERLTFPKWKEEGGSPRLGEEMTLNWPGKHPWRGVLDLQGAVVALPQRTGLGDDSSSSCDLPCSECKLVFHLSIRMTKTVHGLPIMVSNHHDPK